MREFIEEADDWTGFLEGAFRDDFLATLREIPLERLQRLPPPKQGRIPFGHELRVARRFFGGGNALFDPSGLAALYHRLASERERLAYRAFIANEALPRNLWEDLIGREALDAWCQHQQLREDERGLRARFGLYQVGRVALLGDPPGSPLLRRVLVGQDSLMMGEFMLNRGLEHCGRYLDVGPGSGVVLLNVSSYADACVGLDINPRAVAISSLNADLNGITNCTIQLEDAIRNGAAHGPFDLVTWNTPFVFLPEECKDTHYDAYGGDFGMEIPLQFLEVLPELLAENGRAFLAAAAPIMRSGENLLEEKLEALARERGLVLREHITQFYWHPHFREFHESHGIRKFEHSFIEVTVGGPRVERVEAPIASRLSDAVRELAFTVLR